MLRVSAGLGDVLGCDPDAAAIHRRGTIIAPPWTAAPEHHVRGEAIPRTRPSGHDIDVPHADDRVQRSKGCAWVVVIPGEGKRQHGTAISQHTDRWIG